MFLLGGDWTLFLKRSTFQSHYTTSSDCSNLNYFIFSTNHLFHENLIETQLRFKIMNLMRAAFDVAMVICFGNEKWENREQ